MHRLSLRQTWQLLLALTMLLVSLPAAAQTPTATQPARRDLAALTAPIQAMPEPGYQVLAGDYLDAAAAADAIAAPRQRDPADVTAILPAQTYVLDLVLLANRGDANADVLALQQTTLYAYADEDAARTALDVIADFSTEPEADELDAVTNARTTVEMRTPSGWTLRSVISQGPIVAEVVSLERDAHVDPAQHDAVVQATLAQLQAGERSALGTMAPAVITPGFSARPFAHAPETGQHALYRVRDGQIQLAAGELEGDASAEVPAGVTNLYVTTTTLQQDAGRAVVSTWLAEGADAVGPSGPIWDPFFTIGVGEPQGDETADGVVPVNGAWNGEPYSGFLQTGQIGDVATAASVRVFGQVTVGQDAIVALADAQQACVTDGGCGSSPVKLPIAAGPTASPTASDGRIISPAFGWRLEIDPTRWTIAGQEQSGQGEMWLLRSGQTDVRLESVVDHLGDPVACVMAELDRLRQAEEHADIRVWDDGDGYVPGGSEPGHAWVTYTVEPLTDARADHEYAIRIDCYALIPGQASLVVTQTAPRNQWLELAPLGDELRNTLTLPN